MKKREWHGHARIATPEYRTWAAIIQRCSNPKSQDYPIYGGRGIKVCERWRNRFVDFLADMGTKPRGASIDRIDNNRGYEPGNCRWADPKTQRANQRPRVSLGFVGASNPMAKLNEWKVRVIRRCAEAGCLSQKEIASAFGISQSAVCLIHKRITWPSLA